jgi:magnesium transporter
MLELRETDPKFAIAIAPTEEELSRLEALGVPRGFLAHALDAHELPRLDRDGDAILVVLRIPRRHHEGHAQPYGTDPFGIVLTPTLTAIVGRVEGEALAATCAWARTHVQAPRHHLVLEAIRIAADSFMTYVQRIDHVVDRLEERLRASLENREVLSLLRCQKGLVYFATALHSLKLLLERLLREAHIGIPAEDHDLVEDVSVEVRQAIVMTETSANVLGNMMDAFASIISNNLNVVMKFLAATTVVLTFPMIVSSYYGMNVGLPGARSSWAFVALVLGSLALAAAVGVLFRRLRWL